MTHGSQPSTITPPFVHLRRPPIIEAVVHWQARAGSPFDPDAVRSALAETLPDYVEKEPVQQLELAAMLTLDPESSGVKHRNNWLGFRLVSKDEKRTVQFRRDGVVVSQTKDYAGWEQFRKAAKPVWAAFQKIAVPVEVERLGVRYINHFPAATPASLADFLRDPPTCPANLPLSEFVYQSTFEVPGETFGVRVIKVMQKAQELPQSSGLFLDCDVFTTRPLGCEWDAFAGTLERMRQLKNGVFFNLVAEKALEPLR